MLSFLWRCAFQILVVPFMWLGWAAYQHQSSAAFEVAISLWALSAFATYVIWTAKEKADEAE